MWGKAIPWYTDRVIHGLQVPFIVLPQISPGSASTLIFYHPRPKKTGVNAAGLVPSLWLMAKQINQKTIYFQMQSLNRNCTTESTQLKNNNGKLN